MLHERIFLYERRERTKHLCQHIRYRGPEPKANTKQKADDSLNSHVWYQADRDILLYLPTWKLEWIWKPKYEIILLRSLFCFTVRLALQFPERLCSHYWNAKVTSLFSQKGICTDEGGENTDNSFREPQSPLAEITFLSSLITVYFRKKTHLIRHRN